MRGAFAGALTLCAAGLASCQRGPTDPVFPNPQQHGGAPITPDVAKCFQKRSGENPSQKELEDWFTSNIITICQDGYQAPLFQSRESSRAHIFNTSYVFYAATLAWQHDVDNCLASFNKIVKSCVVDGGSYGGQILSNGDLFNLTNANYPGSPLAFKDTDTFPVGPMLPQAGKDCPKAFQNKTSFDISVEAGNTISQDFDIHSHPQMFEANTQWRFFASDLTVVKSWSIDFHGDVKPEVTMSKDETIATFQMLDPPPMKITVTGKVIEGLTNTNPGYKATMMVEGTVSTNCSGDWDHIPWSTTHDRRPTRDEIQSRCDIGRSQWSLDDGSYWANSLAGRDIEKLVAEFKGFEETQTRFDAYVTKHYFGPDDWTCGLFESKCKAGLECMDCDSTAGFAILQSFSGLVMYYNTLLHALEAATGDIGLTQSTFTAAFTEPENSPDSFLKVAMSAFTAILSVMNAYVGFAAGVTKAGAFEGKLLAGGSTALNAVSGGLVAVAKDTMPVAEQTIINQAQISSGLLKYIDATKDALSNYVNSLFQRGAYTAADGTKYPITNVISGGYWLSSPFKTFDSVDITTDWRKVFYGKMMQVAWRTHTGRVPVILGPYENLDNEKVFIIGKDDTTLGEFYSNRKVKFDNEWYVLAAYDNQKKLWGNTGGNVKTLDGNTDNWGGITLEDVIVSSVSGWKRSNRKNGYEMSDAYATSRGGEPAKLPYQDGVRTPGFFNIPVCRFRSDNWATEVKEYGLPVGDIDEKTWPHFPCKE